MQGQRNPFLLKFILSLTLAILAGPGLVGAVGMLPNGSFETFQKYGWEEWRGYAEKYGENWNLQVISGEDRLHLMDSDTLGRFIAQYYGQPYLNYHLEGGMAQTAVSQYPFNFVLFQSIPVEVNKGYSFGGKIVTFWKGSGPPVDHTQIFKRIGLDPPTGGTAWDSPDVIWTDWDSTDNAWVSPALAARSQASQMTLFIQVENKSADVGTAYLNTCFIDSFKFEPAPSVNLSLPASAKPGPVQVLWQAVIPDSYWNLWGYDVQYREEPGGDWQTIQVHDGANRQNQAYTLANAEAGKSYTFRARLWQQAAPNGDAAVTALPGLWTEKTIIITGKAVEGRVFDYVGLPLAGVTITAGGVLTPATSRSNGSYWLPTGAAGTFDLVATGVNNLVAPPAMAVETTLEENGYLSISLRPGGDNQALADNDFEGPSGRWQSGDGSAITLSSAERHTGNSSLWLPANSSVFQENNVTGFRNPLLSFWYKSQVPLTVQLLGPESTPISEQTLEPAANWTFHTLAGGLGPAYTGNAGVKFINPAGSGDIFIDEASIGPGPFQTYLPLILLNSDQNLDQN